MARSKPTIIDLWPEGNMPGTIPVDFEETIDEGNYITGVSIPQIHHYSPSNQSSKSAIVICPGGGYSLLSFLNSGTRVAQWFNQLGMHAFVLKNRLKEYGHPYPLADLQRAIRTIRKNADQYNIDTNKIGVIGFSAGGHLAASASTLFNEQTYNLENDHLINARPDFTILDISVITMGPVTHTETRDNLLGPNAPQELIDKYSCEKQVTPETPPCFISHTSDDDYVPVENSILYYQALVANKVDAEIHIYRSGGHHVEAIFNKGKISFNNWNDNLINWLKAKSII